MRLFELKNNLSNRPIVYVDMDGVLADFFGAIAKDHGVEHWRDIKQGDIAIVQSAQKDGFFRSLPRLPNAHSLIKAVVQIAGEYSILSSPLQSEVERSSEEKSHWLEKHLGQAQPQSVVFDHEKYRYAKQPDGTPNILIDDFPVNIKLWRQHGGIAIPYRDSKSADAVAMLKQAMDDPMRFVQTDAQKVPSIMEDINKLFTNRDVLSYVKGIHKKYRLDDPIQQVKVWKLVHMPTSFCSSPEYYHQDDPYRREIDLDWDHIKKITIKDIMTKPPVTDADGWVLDGNHRVTAARLHGLELIPLIVPAV